MIEMLEELKLIHITGPREPAAQFGRVLHI
jgi:hypothetical protein